MSVFLWLKEVSINIKSALKGAFLTIYI